MQTSNIFVILFIVGTIFHFVLNQILEFTDFYSRKKQGAKVPPELEQYLTQDTLLKTSNYENAKYYLWIIHNIINFILTFTLVFSGFYVTVYEWVISITQNVYLTAILFLMLCSIPSAILDLPFELYGEFVIEKKFGFSTMTFKLWIIDQLKNLIVSAIISIPLLCVMLALLLHANSWWWILLGAVYVAFSFAVSFLYPKFIAPLFNKFTPIQEGELKTQIVALLNKTGFKSNGVFMMDASKRSKHSNAYFTGVGKTKRIVLYDTLVNQMTTEEIIAVLGHELGHYKKHHVVKRMCIMIPLIFLVLFVAKLFITLPSLYTGFGFTPDTLLINGIQSVTPTVQFIGIFLLSLIVEGFTDITGLISNTSSRRDEFAADKFSAQVCGSGKPLSTALIKLNKENLSEVTPPKIYSVFNYSHPPLLERIKAVEKIGG